MASGALSFPHGVFMGPLRQGADSGKNTARHLYRLMVALGVRKADIGKIVVEPEEGFALIELHSTEAVDFLVKACKDVRDMLNFYDLRFLTNKPRQFKVMRQSSRRALQQQQEEKESVPQLKIEPENMRAPGTSANDDTPVTQESAKETYVVRGTKREGQSIPLDANTWTENPYESSSSTFQMEFEQLEEELPPPTCLHASTSTSASHDARDTEPVAKVDVKTSTPHVSPCFCPDTVFYHKKQLVGSENRHVEFKRGGNVSDLRAFRSVVGKYMCAFLNTEGGTIYFGVTDDGRVLGIEACQRREDMIRLNIDNVVTTLKPFVDPSTYSVNFAKVMGDDGTIAEDVKVLEICIKPRDSPRQKFTFNDIAYVRRDGSLRTL